MLAHALNLINRITVFGVSADCGEGTGSLKCETGLPNVGASHHEIGQILTIVFGIIAAVAVLMIVISGFRFIIAQGNPQEVAKARNTIIYAVIGLLVAITAEGIVAFTLSGV